MENKTMVIVDKEKHTVIQGNVSDMYCMIDVDGLAPGAADDFVIFVEKELSTNGKQKCRLVHRSTVFDEDDFYNHRVAPDKFIDTKYAVGDYLLGFMNIDAPNGTTPRLVGGVIKDIRFDTNVTSKSYWYNIYYTIELDVFYSIEQFRRDGMREDCFYSTVNQGHAGTKIEVNENYTIDLVDRRKNLSKRGISTDPVLLSKSHKHNLYFIMALLVMKSWMRGVTTADMHLILDRLLQSSWNVMFPSNVRGANVIEYCESPISMLLDGIMGAISAILDPNVNPDIIEQFNNQYIAQLLTSENVMCCDIGMIPWSTLSVAMHEYLTDPKLCGISHTKFTNMICDVIHDKCAAIDNCRGIYGNLDGAKLLIRQIESSMEPYISRGVHVKLDMRNRIPDKVAVIHRSRTLDYTRFKSIIASDRLDDIDFIVEDDFGCRKVIKFRDNDEEFFIEIDEDVLLPNNSDIVKMNKIIFAKK